MHLTVDADNDILRVSGQLSCPATGTTAKG